MSSTRNVSIGRRLLFSCAAVVASATPFSLTGCQRVQPPHPDVLSDTPLIVDEAMQIRDWDRSTAHYASGAVVAGSPRLTFEPKDDTWLNVAVDPLIGVGNFVLIPFTIFSTLPGEAVAHHGAIVPPTHTAMPLVRVIE